ncbi:MAG: alpha/beta hydrolase, partial [Archangiaceae bacterium]|nr:alpha/beta hydrolase [Archangiaceae bacterium]
IDYRLSGVARFPAQIHDVKAAVRWLRAHATQYRLDPARLSAWGQSAGAHLAMLLGTSSGVTALEDLSQGNPTESSRIGAVIDWFGPTDFLKMDAQTVSGCSSQNHDAADSPESKLVGCQIQTCPQKSNAASPLTYVDAADPPMVLMHGAKDCTVPTPQANLMDAALRAVECPRPWSSCPTSATTAPACSRRGACSSSTRFSTRPSTPSPLGLLPAKTSLPGHARGAVNPALDAPHPSHRLRAVDDRQAGQPVADACREAQGQPAQLAAQARPEPGRHRGAPARAPGRARAREAVDLEREGQQLGSQLDGEMLGAEQPGSAEQPAGQAPGAHHARRARRRRRSHRARGHPQPQPRPALAQLERAAAHHGRALREEHLAHRGQPPTPGLGLRLRSTRDAFDRRLGVCPQGVAQQLGREHRHRERQRARFALDGAGAGAALRCHLQGHALRRPPAVRDLRGRQAVVAALVPQRRQLDLQLLGDGLSRGVVGARARVEEHHPALGARHGCQRQPGAREEAHGALGPQLTLMVEVNWPPRKRLTYSSRSRSHWPTSFAA